MTQRLCLIIIFTFSAPTFVYSQSTLPSQFESWNEVQLIVPLVQEKDNNGKSIDKVTATFNGIVRLGRSDWEFLDNRAGATIDFRVNNYLSLMTAVLYRRDEQVKNVRRYETRLDFGATVSKAWRNFTFRDRNMFEHRFRNRRGDINVYRNKMQVSYSIRHKDEELFTPFISDEGYYSLTQHSWVQNEFFAGISRRINKRTVLDLAYIRNDTQPVNVNGLSLTLKIKLR